MQDARWFEKTDFANFLALNEVADAVLEQKASTRPASIPPKQHFGRYRTRRMLEFNFRTTLGKMLFYAAFLLEAIDCYQEEKLMEKYLHSSSPLHPRRSPTQLYHWTLQSRTNLDKN